MRSTAAGGGSALSVVTAQPASQEATTAHERTIARRFIIRRLKDASFRQKSQSCHLQKTPLRFPSFEPNPEQPGGSRLQGSVSSPSSTGFASASARSINRRCSSRARRRTAETSRNARKIAEKVNAKQTNQ